MEETNLLAKRSELKTIITEGIEKTFPAYFFNWIGRGLMKIFRLKKMPHWTVNALIQMILVFLPGVVVSILTGEIFHWKEINFLTWGIEFIGVLSTIVCHINVSTNVLPGLRDGFVDFVQSSEDLDKLKRWLESFWSFRNWMTFLLVGGLVLSLLGTYIFISTSGNGVGLGQGLLIFTTTPFFVITLYVIFKMIFLPTELSKYHLELYEGDPASSEVIQRLASILSTYLYIVAGAAAIGQALLSLAPVLKIWMYIIVVIVWIPTVIQFIANQAALKKIITNAKLQTLNRLQMQIRTLQSGDLGGAPDGTISRINQLMDLHDRIKGKPNSILNLNTGLGFLNQMMLPLLGWLLGNVDKLLGLLNP